MIDPVEFDARLKTPGYVTHRLGEEWDISLLRRLVERLHRDGATMSSSLQGMAGSQELTQILFNKNGKDILIEAETYFGINLTGEPETIAPYRDLADVDRQDNL